MEGHFRDLLTKKRTTTRLKPPTLTKVTYVVVEDGRDKIRFKQCSKLLFAEYSSNTLSIPELKSAILKDHTRRQKSEGRVCDDRCVKLYLSVRGQEITDVSDLPKLFKYTTPLYAEFKKPITVSPEMDLTSRLKRELDTDACVDLEWTNTQIQPQRPAKKARQPCSDVYQHSQYIPRNVRVVPENLNSLIVEAGNDIPSNIPTIECFRLSIVTKQWVKNEDFSGRIDFDKNDSHFVGEGGFRKCYKAKVFTDLGTKDVAVKFFSERGKNRLRDFFALDEQSSLDMEQAINRDIQVNESSMNLAAVFNSKVPANWSIFFNPSYFGKMKDKEGTEELCFVEPLLKGSFWRAISNNGQTTKSKINAEMAKKCSAFAHFTWVYSEKKFMVLDLQGMGSVLMDPALITSTTIDPENRLFNPANFSQRGIDTFLREHKCSEICETLGLASP